MKIFMEDRQKGVALVGKFGQSLYVTIWYLIISFLNYTVLFQNNEVEHGEQEVVGAAAGSSAIHTTIPRPQPEEPLEESITENEEEPEYSNYGALAENDMDEIQERRNFKLLKHWHTRRIIYMIMMNLPPAKKWRMLRRSIQELNTSRLHNNS